MRGRMPGRRPVQWSSLSLSWSSGDAGGRVAGGDGEEHVVEAGSADGRHDAVCAAAGVVEHVQRARAGPCTRAVGRHLEQELAVASCSSTTSPPIRAFSSAAVPSATIRPPSSTAMRSASWSASSRYWVVRKTVVPAPASERMTLPELLPAPGVEPGRRLVEEQHRRRHDEAEREVESPAHAAGVGADPRGRGIREVEALEQLGGARRGPRDAPSPESRPSIMRFSVPVSTSSTAADWPVRLMRLLHLLGVGDDVVAGDQRRARVGPHERREDVDGRRLAGAVRPEQGEHLPRRHREVEAARHARCARSACGGRERRWRVSSPAPFVGLRMSKLFM